MKIPGNLPPSKPFAPQPSEVPKKQRFAAVKCAVFSALATHAHALASVAPVKDLPPATDPNTEALILLAEIDLAYKQGNFNPVDENGVPLTTDLGNLIRNGLITDPNVSAIVTGVYVQGQTPQNFMALWQAQGALAYTWLLQQNSGTTPTAAQAMNLIIFMVDYTSNNVNADSNFWPFNQSSGSPVSMANCFPVFILAYLYQINNSGGVENVAQFNKDYAFLAGPNGLFNGVDSSSSGSIFVMDAVTQLQTDYGLLMGSNPQNPTWNWSSLGLPPNYDPSHYVTFMIDLLTSFFQND